MDGLKKIFSLELTKPVENINGLQGYKKAIALVKFCSRSIGYVEVPIKEDQCRAIDIGKAIADQLQTAILRQVLADWLEDQIRQSSPRINDLFLNLHSFSSNLLPLVTVAVCTRNRTEELELCLRSLNALNYKNLDILIIDNAPKNDATKQLVQDHFPNMRYEQEPRPGLNWARNRAILECRGEILAFTDDDVIVDSDWILALVNIYSHDPNVMAVTGLVAPFELETKAQIYFEEYGGFGRGFERKWYSGTRSRGVAKSFGGAGKFGTGANMSFRRSLFDEIGFFDPALDVGTVTNGGGDLDIFFRTLKEGHKLVYEPSAVVFHCHRRSYYKLREQIANNGIGFYSYLVRNAIFYPDERISIFILGVWWFWWWNLRRLLASFIRPDYFPRDLIITELWGSIKGLKRYHLSRKNTTKIIKIYGSSLPNKPGLLSEQSHSENPTRSGSAIRSVDISQPLELIQGVEAFFSTQVFITWKNRLIGHVQIENCYQTISKMQLIDAILSDLLMEIIDIASNESAEKLLSSIIEYVEDSCQDDRITTKRNSNLKPNISVVIATYDRPDNLRNCLRSLVNQQTQKSMEIIVVDNHPKSGKTPVVTAEFPQIVLIEEPRQGLSYARNAGILHGKGEIVVMTDDDVEMPAGWLENLIEPFARNDVMVVTGNILPFELETKAQNLFETYGGLGRGYKTKAVDKKWFDSYRFKAVPMWELGATANAAFRADIFNHSEIGLLDEALGAGTPTGCSEDTMIFYQVLRMGYSIYYKPEAYVWHKHRQEMSSLRRQIYNYSKGHVAYILTTLMRYKDLRALVRLAVELPLTYLWRLKEYILHKSNYPLSLILLEIIGNLSGGWALLFSRWRVRRLGHSQSGISAANEMRLHAKFSGKNQKTIWY